MLVLTYRTCLFKEIGMPETEHVIAAMTQYLQDVLEQPHPVFGGMPICPFAKHARLENKIDFQVYRFQSKDLEPASPLIQKIQHFAQQQCAQTPAHDVLFVIHPDQQAMSCLALKEFVEHLNRPLQTLQLTAFGGHPEDDFNIQGVLTRREPYINLTIQAIAKLKRASASLATTHYYDHWTPEALQAVGYPR